jgi:hypothetical protein
MIANGRATNRDQNIRTGCLGAVNGGFKRGKIIGCDAKQFRNASSLHDHSGNGKMIGSDNLVRPRILPGHHQFVPCCEYGNARLPEHINERMIHRRRKRDRTGT